jgi:hypothetical protein
MILSPSGCSESRGCPYWSPRRVYIPSACARSRSTRPHRARARRYAGHTRLDRITHSKRRSNVTRKISPLCIRATRVFCDSLKTTQKLISVDGSSCAPSAPPRTCVRRRMVPPRRLLCAPLVSSFAVRVVALKFAALPTVCFWRSSAMSSNLGSIFPIVCFHGRRSVGLRLGAQFVLLLFVLCGFGQASGQQVAQVVPSIRTIAGNYAAGAGYSGDSGPATSAELYTPG